MTIGFALPALGAVLTEMTMAALAALQPLPLVTVTV
jgi:hypothetical protein